MRTGSSIGFVRKEALITSQIEGTQATLQDVLAFEAGQKPHRPEEVRDVCNYAVTGCRRWCGPALPTSNSRRSTRSGCARFFGQGDCEPPVYLRFEIARAGDKEPTEGGRPTEDLLT